MFALDISEAPHSLQIYENDVVIRGAHHMAWMDVPVQITAIMEELQALNN